MKPFSLGVNRRTALILIVLIILLTLFLLRSPISQLLYNWTGEEDPIEQIKGVGALLLLRLTQPPIETKPFAPIAHTGVNPYGVNTFLEQEVEEEKVRLSLEMIRDAGFKWIRQEFPWEDIEIHSKGNFWDRRVEPPRSAWEKYDRIVALAEEYGLEIVARLDNPPAWSRAEGDAKGTLAPPDDFDNYGDFVYAVVNRYKGRVKYYQIWNEPNIYPEWGEQPVDAARYVELLKVGYTRAKEADPDCIVLSAGLAPTLEMGPMNLSDLVFLEQMYDAGARGYFDILAVMGYGLWTGPTDRRASPDRTNFSRPLLIRQIMVEHGDEGKPIWAMEMGWNAVPSHLPAPFGRVSEEQQARYAVQAYRRAQEEWPWMGVIFYWFFKRADEHEIDQPFYYFRMLDPDFTPRPVYWALKELATAPPLVQVGFHQEDHWALAYEGAWQVVEDERASLGSYRASNRAGDGVSFTFKGTDLDLVVIKDSGSGTLHLVVDGKAQGDIDLHSAEPLYQVQVPIVPSSGFNPGLDGEHRVEIALGEEGKRCAIDGLIVR